ncbi:hypothetical protein NDU88_004204 [Pleurodeles waltl]|uniref:Uncharacterized protein n=1 Tax=Pleurodeles waltl TaxID=8319 RepID=A0AAV7SIA1_PLEWA|nr:hypothetical protein NDU88_004204 [Pleurodeles waltl]
MFKTIAATNYDLSYKVNAVAIKLGPLRADQQKLAGRVPHVEREVTEIDQTVQDLEEQMHSLTSNVRELEARAEESKERSHHNNLRIVGILEGRDSTDPTLCFKQWLSQKVAKQINCLITFSWNVLIECHHKVLHWGHPQDQ